MQSINKNTNVVINVLDNDNNKYIVHFYTIHLRENKCIGTYYNKNFY